VKGRTFEVGKFEGVFGLGFENLAINGHIPWMYA
jgi:hypothetical protein